MSKYASYGCVVRADGVVEHWAVDKAGRRTDWIEPLSESTVREVFADWVWVALKFQFPSLHAGESEGEDG